MIQEWYEKGWFFYLMAAVCGIGILSKFFLGWYFSRMVRSTENMWRAKKKWLVRMQQDYLECTKEFGKVHNVDIFVDKYVGNRKFLGIMLSTWDKLSGQTMLICGGIAILATITGVYYRCDRGTVLFTFFVGIWLIIMNLVVDNLANLAEKREQTARNLKDYFINRMTDGDKLIQKVIQKDAELEGISAVPLPETAASKETANAKTKEDGSGALKGDAKEGSRQRYIQGENPDALKGDAKEGNRGRYIQGENPDVLKEDAKEGSRGRYIQGENPDALKGDAKEGNRGRYIQGENSGALEEDELERKQSRLYVIENEKQEAARQAALNEDVIQPKDIKTASYEQPAKVVEIKTASRKESKKEAAARKKRERMKRQAALELEQERRQHFNKEETAAAKEAQKAEDTPLESTPPENMPLQDTLPENTGKNQIDMEDSQENGQLIEEVLREFLV